MVKKSFMLFCIVLMIFVSKKVVKAESNYQHFEQMDLASGKMLEDFTEKDYSNYYSKVNKRRFWGWKIYYVHKNVKVKYISETIFSYYNNGTSVIKYAYSLEEQNVNKISVSGSGSIGYTLNGTKNTFKHGLDSALKLNADAQNSVSSLEKMDLVIDVEPNTVANLRIKGEGKITNGVAARYLFWIRANLGGFEYFIVTTEYPRLEVLPI